MAGFTGDRYYTKKGSGVMAKNLKLVYQTDVGPITVYSDTIASLVKDAFCAGKIELIDVVEDEDQSEDE
jgi:hypothetical protein